MTNKINRRNFLQKSALISTGLFLGSTGLFSVASNVNKTISNPNISHSNKKKRKIGSLEVSPIGLGCMSMAGVYNPPQDKAEMALAWLTSQKPYVVPISGTTNPKHLMENIGALNIEFTNTELQEFRISLDAIPTIDFRKPESVFQNQ
jgi:hypothetical protein